MANSIQCFLEVSNLNSNVKNFIKCIESDYSFYFKKLNESKMEFITTYLDLEEFKDVSEESKLSLIYYDTSMGYARKCVYDKGYLISKKSVLFPMDLEIEINEKSKINNSNFYEELDLYIEQNGIEESNFPKIGDFIRINELICSDTDVINWLENQKENKFKVNNVEIESNGIWIDGCNYRLDLSECSKVDC